MATSIDKLADSVRAPMQPDTRDFHRQNLAKHRQNLTEERERLLLLGQHNNDCQARLDGFDEKVEEAGLLFLDCDDGNETRKRTLKRKMERAKGRFEEASKAYEASKKRYEEAVAEYEEKRSKFKTVSTI